MAPNEPTNLVRDKNPLKKMHKKTSRKDKLAANLITLLSNALNQTFLPPMPVIHEVLDNVVAQFKEENPLLDRDDLVEMMADHIESDLSDCTGPARKEAEKHGDVDDDMVNEAFLDAVGRIESWG